MVMERMMTLGFLLEVWLDSAEEMRMKTCSRWNEDML